MNLMDRDSQLLFSLSNKVNSIECRLSKIEDAMDTEKIPYPPLSAKQSLEELVASESIRLSALIEQVSKLSETIKVIGDNLSRIRMDLDQLKSNLGES